MKKKEVKKTVKKTKKRKLLTNIFHRFSALTVAFFILALALSYYIASTTNVSEVLGIISK